MATTTLHENSPMDITHSAPSPGEVKVVSGDESSTITDAGGSIVDDLNESQLLRDDEAVEDSTEGDIKSIPIIQELLKIRDKSANLTAYAKNHTIQNPSLTSERP